MRVRATAARAVAAAVLAAAVGSAAVPVRAQEDAPPILRGPPPGRVALQSMVVPGWGQVSNRAWIKSVGFLGAYAGLVAWGVDLNQQKQDAAGELNRARGTEDEGFWQLEVGRLEDSRNGKFWLAGLVMLLSMADALVDAHLYKFEETIDADVARGSDGGAEVRLRLTLPIAGNAP